MSNLVDKIHNNPFISHLPEAMTNFPRGLFNSFPVFTPSEGRIEKGFEKLAAIINKNIPLGLRVLVIDGFQGVEWDNV